MSTIIAALQPSLENLLVSLVLLAVSVTVAILVGAHRVKTVRGPLRGAPHANGALILGVGVLGYAMWVLATLVLVSLMVPQTTTTGDNRSTTQPVSTRPETPDANEPPGIQAASTQSTDLKDAMRPVEQADSARPSRQLSRAQIVSATVMSAIVGILALWLLDRRLGLGGWGQLGMHEHQIGSAIVPVVIGSFCAIPGTIAISFLVQMGIAWFQPQSQVATHELLVTLSQSSSWSVKLLVVVSAVLVAPLFEELLFRGYFQTGLVRMGLHRWTSIIIVSVGFAAIHQTLWMMPPIFFLSVCLGYAYERTGNLWVPIAMHAAFNALNVTARLFT